MAKKTKPCSPCEKALTKYFFSKKQWSKKAGQGRCKKCIETGAGTTASSPPASPTKPASSKPTSTTPASPSPSSAASSSSPSAPSSSASPSAGKFFPVPEKHLPSTRKMPIGESDSEVVKEFKALVNRNAEIAIAVAAIQTLTTVVKRSKASTIHGLHLDLKEATEHLKACRKSSISLAAGCDLFGRYVTRTALDVPDFDLCRKRLIERGERFAEMSSQSRDTINHLVGRFITDGKVLLVHGFSRVVIGVLKTAAAKRKKFSVVVTEGRPECDGYQIANELKAAGIPVTLVLDAAVGYVMEQVDLVLLGSEAVVENGGIINKVGSYQIAIIAQTMRRPVYVATESYKFARLFPLGQEDLPERKEDQQPLIPAFGEFAGGRPELLTIDNPSCDYTPPKFITLLFTDLGILTPSAVSDELIKLYENTDK